MKKLFLSLFMIISLNPVALACSTCFGNPNSRESKAIFIGVMVMLTVIGGVLSGIVAAIVNMSRRSRKLGLNQAGASA